MTDVDKDAKLLDSARSNLLLALGSFDPYAASEKPAFLTAIASTYKMLHELHGEKEPEQTPEQIAKLLEDTGLTLLPTPPES